MTTYTLNKEHNGIEIYFDGKPSEAIRDSLKALKYRWHSVKKCWYAKETPERLDFAKSLTDGTREPGTIQTVKTYIANKDTLRAEYSKEWNDPKMIDYCVNKATHMVTMSDGTIIPIEKESIETRFCFGESGYDYNEAQDMAHHARTSEDYFRSENLKGFDRTINDITEQIESFTSGGYILTIGKHKNSNIGYMHYERVTAILDARGGSAYLEDLPGNSIDIWGTTYRIPTTEELTELLEAHKEARAKHEKRVNTYLKKYGLSNVRSWTYWRDR